jgi:hypothetical protein
MPVVNSGFVAGDETKGACTVTQSLSWCLDVRQSIVFAENTLSGCHLALQSSLSALAQRMSVDPFARRETNGSRLSSWRDARLKDGITIGLVLCLSLGIGADVRAAAKKAEVKQVTVGEDELSCPIRISDPYGGRLTPTRYVLDHVPCRGNGPRELYIQLSCVSSADGETLRSFVPATFDQDTSQWKEDLSATSTEDLAMLKPVTQIFPLQAANSSGIAVTQEAVNGDERTRDRRFAFCLRHPPVMLCGGTSQIARPYYKNSDLLPFALRIVRSIEFVDAPSTAPPMPGDALDDRKNGVNPIRTPVASQ